MYHPIIVRLPTELLLEVGAWINFVDPHHRSLLQLAQTCHRFYALFKPQIIFHIADCIFKCSDTRRMKSNGLEYPSDPNTTTSRILVEKPLKSICIPFNRDNTFDDTRCIRGLIFHARGLTSVTIDLCSSTNVDYRVLVCLLNSCVQRAGMELNMAETGVESQLFDGSHAEDQHTAMRQDSMSWFSATIIKYVFGGGTLPFKATPNLPRYRPQLTALHIIGGTLFSEIMYPWTLHILNTAPLTRLSITQVRLATCEWSRILPSISIPTLTYLGVGSIPVSFQDLLLFLARHSRLETIDLSNNLLIGATSFPVSLPKSIFLPNLRLMIAPPIYIDIFVQRHRQGYCPKLTVFRNAHIQSPRKRSLI